MLPPSNRGHVLHHRGASNDRSQRGHISEACCTSVCQCDSNYSQYTSWYEIILVKEGNTNYKFRFCNCIFHTFEEVYVISNAIAIHNCINY